MALGKFTKTPDEAKRYAIDYSEWLDTGEYISHISFNVISSVTDIVIVPGSIGATDTEVLFFVSGGTVGTTYTIAVTMTTSTNQVKQDTVVYSVRALS